MPRNYDALVIGSGTAGQTAAHALKRQKLSVALVEHSDRPGGTCAQTGCQAKKWFYEGVEAVARSRHLAGIGIITPAVASWRDQRDAKNRFTESVPASTVSGLKSAAFKLLAGEDGMLLGAYVISNSATGLIQACTLAMMNRIRVADFYRQCILTPYPSRESDITRMLKPLIE